MGTDEELMKIKVIFTRYIISFDFMLSILFTIVFSFLIVKNNDDKLLLIISEKLTDVGITVFSVIFPLFFTAFSIIIASSDDKFSKFLQKKGFYQEIIKTFKFTLFIIFIAFIYSIILYSTINVLYELLNKT